MRGGERLYSPANSLIQEFRDNLRGFAGAGDEKEMPVIEGDEARAGNKRRQDAAVGDRHDRIVRAGQDQRRLLQKAQPGQAAPAKGGDQLQVIAVVARPAWRR